MLFTFINVFKFELLLGDRMRVLESRTMIILIQFLLIHIYVLSLKLDEFINDSIQFLLIKLFSQYNLLDHEH